MNMEEIQLKVKELADSNNLIAIKKSFQFDVSEEIKEYVLHKRIWRMKTQSFIKKIDNCDSFRSRSLDYYIKSIVNLEAEKKELANKWMDIPSLNHVFKI